MKPEPPWGTFLWGPDLLLVEGVCWSKTSSVLLMDDRASGCVVEPITVREEEVQVLLDALTAELATSGYTPEQTFGYSVEQLEDSGVHLLGARVAGQLVGVAGIEVQGEGIAELKRFFVQPQQRGTGVADALVTALMAHAAARDVRLVRLETGDEQQAALGFYRRHGFGDVPRFGPYEASETSICMERSI